MNKLEQINDDLCKMIDMIEDGNNTDEDILNKLKSIANEIYLESEKE